MRAFRRITVRAQAGPDDHFRELAKEAVEKDNGGLGTATGKQGAAQPQWVEAILEEAREDEELAETIKGY